MLEDIKNALKTLERGGVILYPTDTIWGIGCDATNQEAVNKIYRLKKRHEKKSMLVLLDSANALYNYVEKVPPIAHDIIEYSDKPITIIYANAINLAPNLIHEDGSIGIRVAQDEFCKQLIFKFKRPIVSTSANISGEPQPAIFSQIGKNITDSVDYVVKWRQDDKERRKSSSIIKLSPNSEVKIIRK
ncbi:MAG: threonylcarbamoyl-AMP synthase [Bacteroidia bacterium]|nr:MAG: threonylcarbamoyl-AMP synthase [Bacteroidia bacterium]PIE86453.1 MAG: threonylcarbamoyl-AMP synthase [Bacteroidia bacterium]